MRKSGMRKKANPTGFVGIYNQGSTCYLNTLLQTFYMSPEVKDTIIRSTEQRFKKIIKDASITYQLKELFAKLDARETPRTDLITRNLGMSRDDVYKQQDIEEYFRRLVNKVGKETEGETCNILQIYQSKMINCQRCLECKVEATTECNFLDIPLPVRSNDRGIRIQNVNATFQDFLGTSILDGDNLCYCERCDKKTELEIRYYFEKLPQILVLQLKRFEVDHFTRSMKKMHDKVEIPLKIKFQKKRNKNNDKTEWSLSSSESNEAAAKRRSSSPRSGLYGRSRSHESEESLRSQRNKNSQESKEANFSRQQSSLAGSKRRRNSEPRVNPENDITYNLFAICNHAGEFGGGHYVAHIRPESSSKWYCFDDSYVTEVEDFVSEECRDNAVPCIRSSTAYLLMYRKEKANFMEESVGGTETDAKAQRIKMQGICDEGNRSQQSKDTFYPNLQGPPGKNRARRRDEMIRTRGGRNQTETVIDNRDKPTVGDKSDEINIKSSKETRAEKTMSQCSNENSQVEVKLEQAELTDVIRESNDNEKIQLITKTCTEAESEKSVDGLSVTNSTEADDYTCGCGCFSLNFAPMFQTFSNFLKELSCC